jgi:hypothetical protein
LIILKLIFTVFPWETKILQMHAFDEIEFSVLRLAVNCIRMFTDHYFKYFEYFSVRIIMSAEKSIFFTS